MNNRKENKTFFVIVGSIILGVFISISLINMAAINEDYFLTDIVKETNYSNGKLVITTRNDIVSVCVKQTKTKPTIDSLCWVDTINTKATMSIYEYKTYYIWTKDINNTITYYNKYNTQDS